VGFTGREVRKSLKVSLKVFCGLSLNDAALIHQIFCDHTHFLGSVTTNVSYVMTFTIYPIVVFMSLLAFLSMFYKNPCVSARFDELQCFEMRTSFKVCNKEVLFENFTQFNVQSLFSITVNISSVCNLLFCDTDFQIF